MEAARGGLLSPTPLTPPIHHHHHHRHHHHHHHPRTHTHLSLNLRNASAPSHSSVNLHDRPSRLGASTMITSVVRHFPASVLTQEQRDDWKSYIGDDKLAKVTSDRTKVDDGASVSEETNPEFKKYLKYFERRLLHQPGFWYLLPTYIEEELVSSNHMEYLISETYLDTNLVREPRRKDNASVVRPLDALALAKKAMLATQAAASLAENSYLLGDDLDESSLSSLVPEKLAMKKPTIRSGRLLGRQLKKRIVPKKQDAVLHEVYSRSMRTEISRKIDRGLNSNDPLRLFLGDPETRRLLTVKEERDLFIKIEDLMRVEDVKSRLHMQFVREPTLVEWAEAVGMNRRELQSCLDSGNRSREKMVNANFRLVVHVAKKYQGKGLDLQDLLQVGSMGLMKSLKKFKPTAGCRFPTYAYWWIRQSIKKAIFQNSRTIRLPENVFATLKKIKSSRRLYIQEEGHYPNNEDLAQRAGITVEKLERLLITSRSPVSIQECVWTDQDATFQEITADPQIETPDHYTAKQMMRQHARNLVRILPPRERQIIRFRYGLDDGKQKTLSDIGDVYGISKERIRQLESRALDMLKECLDSQGLEAYVNLLI